ncbi:MAG: 8-oxo-dGTP diphosphatase [Defluviitaleaceae bacterium]|nr:8-oxo-dGTP diphosphatase [Defluviitaleaceae bacterium]
MKLATLCYLEKDGKYLLLHRTKKENDMHAGKYIGLGGKVEPGESPEECVTREVQEESGLAVKSPKLRGVLTFPAFAKEEDWYVFLFTVTEFTGEIQPCPEGELVWVDKASVHNLPMHEGDYIFLGWLNKHENVFTAKFNYKNGKLQNYKLNC